MCSVPIIQSAYASLDTFPAPKGASVHIGKFAPALFETVSPGLLLVLGDLNMPKWQIDEKGNEIRRLISTEENFLTKALDFQDFVFSNVAPIKDTVKLAHFRDPWSGLPLIDATNGKAKLVYEVNALPSKELPSRYPFISSTTLNMISKMENFCLERADHIICPSEVIKRYLISIGTDAHKITCIHNGADIDSEICSKVQDTDEPYIFYTGAVQPWQGVENLLKAFSFLDDIPDLKLVMCVSGTKSRIKYLMKLWARLGREERVIWKIRLAPSEVKKWLKNALLSLAPLTECERNIVQGCCPIKILDSMAAGVPVVASDMAVTRELLVHGKSGWLVRPDRPSELARAIKILLAHPERRALMAETALKQVKSKFTWSQAADKLKCIYRNILCR